MKHKKIFNLTLILVIICEVIIFFTAYNISGEKKRLQVRTVEGELVYEVNGERLQSFDKYYFENNFGSLDNYKIRLVEKNVPFPVRGWFFASIGVPVGLSLILLFFVKILSFFYPSIKEKFLDPESDFFKKDSKISFKTRFFSLNIFYAGIFLFAASFIFWALPIVFNSAADRFLFTVSRYPLIFSVFFLSVFIFLFYLFYLKFRLRKFEIEKKYMIELKKIENNIIEISDSDTLKIENKMKNYIENNGAEN
ncbi:MAG: hypothetical protein H6680_02605 [Desulfobacteraceae bacterium]|nr:hypothetical protein [Desulfobacteraceae bacterium]